MLRAGWQARAAGSGGRLGRGPGRRPHGLFIDPSPLPHGVPAEDKASEWLSERQGLFWKQRQEHCVHSPRRGSPAGHGPEHPGGGAPRSRHTGTSCTCLPGVAINSLICFTDSLPREENVRGTESTFCEFCARGSCPAHPWNKPRRSVLPSSIPRGWVRRRAGHGPQRPLATG